jgi:hypothetical protein
MTAIKCDQCGWSFEPPLGEACDEEGCPHQTPAQALAFKIAAALAKQQIETDNLGDNESVVFVSPLPMLNLVELAESLLQQGVKLCRISRT